METLKVNDSLIEAKKQKVLEFLGDNYSSDYIDEINNKYKTKYIISDRYKSTYRKYHGKGARRNGSINWEVDPRVWIKIHSINDTKGHGFAIQIKCKCKKWKSGNSKSKLQFAEKWGFPKNDPNIKYELKRGNLLIIWIVNQAILKFTPHEEYLIKFLNEAYKIYEESNLQHMKKEKGDFTPLVTYTCEDYSTQQNIEDYFYQKEIQESIRGSNKEEVVDIPVKKNLKSNKSSSEVYKRNKQKGVNAIVLAEFNCEVNSKHKEFTSKVTGRNYVEAHHLIPMQYQDDFDVSIDVEANIVSLCASCHRRLHHAVFKEKEAILGLLLDNRKSRLIKCGIVVTEEILFAYYR